MAKICIVSPSLKLGGIERALTTLANEFNERGHEIYFVSCIRADHFYKLPPRVVLVEPTFMRSASVINKLLFYPRLLWFIRTTIISINPDVVLVFGDWFSPLTLLALQGTSYPVFISDRTIPDYQFKFPIPFLKKLLYPNSAGFIAQTTRARDYKVKQFGNKLNIRVIPNALPELGQMEIESPEKGVVLYVGRFAWEKDPEILIRAIAILKKSTPDVHLKMAGDGPLLQPMKDLVEQLGLASNIKFLGPVKDVERLYQLAEILVLPSKIEGFPNTLIEGMSFGLACICFNDIPIDDIIIENVNGVVLHSRDAFALAEKISDLLNNYSMRRNIGMQAKQVVQTFNRKKIAEEYLDFLV
jgi:GalNAc-alpha-(1->4)-GalNAc-alpha-(1->3)-diNAcBac-PP-undecaprenol alpha-1,4-N-acetyl-D-galactosaminyltransferase